MHRQFRLKKPVNEPPYAGVVKVILCMLGVYLVIWAFTGMWPFQDNPYNSYSLQAQSWLEGRLDLGQDYSYLELAIYEGKYFVSFPPFPSILLLPFVLLFGVNTPDHLLTVIAGLIGAVYAYKILKKQGLGETLSVFLALFATIGSGFLFFGFSGWVWFIAQTLSFALCMASIYYAIDDRVNTGWLSLFLWACAVGCRPFQALYLPVLLYLLFKKVKRFNPGMTLAGILKKYVWWALPTLAVAVCYMVLNYARFGSILEFGHNYLPEMMRVETGQFNLAYFAKNMKQLLLPPLVGEGGKIQFPTIEGTSFYLASPIFLYYLYTGIRAAVKKQHTDVPVAVMVPVLIIVHLCVLALHKTLGGWQFGSRYSVDAVPFVILALSYLIKKRDKLTTGELFLFFIGLSLNLVGTVATYNHWI